MSASFWGEYARVQRLVEIGKARDEQLDALLKHYNGACQFDLRDSRRRLKNLERNLARKDRCRLAILKRYARWVGTDPETVSNTMSVAELVAAVRLTAGDDWPLLRMTIDGSYSRVAQTMNVPVGTIKARVSRCRTRIREALAAHAPQAV